MVCPSKSTTFIELEEQKASGILKDSFSSVPLACKTWTNFSMPSCINMRLVSCTIKWKDNENEENFAFTNVNIVRTYHTEVSVSSKMWGVLAKARAECG